MATYYSLFNSYLIYSSEAVTQRCSVKKVFLEISQNSQENTCARVSFLIKLQASTCKFNKKEALAEVLSCEICKISKNIFPYRTRPVAAPDACEIWGQNQNNTLFQRISRLQEKTLRIINFKRHGTPSDPLFKENKILKTSDFIKYKNTEFVRKCLRQENLSIFNEMFRTLNQNHNYNTGATNNYQLDFAPRRTTHYGT